MTLDEVIKVTSRRVNALEHVVIPRIQSYIQYIKKVLDEQAREDFFRLKKLTDKKKRLKEQEIRKRERGEVKDKKGKEGEENEDLLADTEEATQFTDNEKSAIEAAVGDQGGEDLIF